MFSFHRKPVFKSFESINDLISCKQFARLRFISFLIPLELELSTKHCVCSKLELLDWMRASTKLGPAPPILNWINNSPLKINLTFIRRCLFAQFGWNLILRVLPKYFFMRKNQDQWYKIGCQICWVNRAKIAIKELLLNFIISVEDNKI